MSLRGLQSRPWQSHPLGFRLLRLCAPRNDGGDAFHHILFSPDYTGIWPEVKEEILSLFEIWYSAGYLTSSITIIYSVGGILGKLLLPILQRWQRVLRLLITVSPPLLQGVSWSTWRTTPASEAGLLPQFWHLKLSLRITKKRRRQEGLRGVLCRVILVSGIFLDLSVFWISTVDNVLSENKPASLLTNLMNTSNAFLHPPKRCSYAPAEYLDNGLHTSE